MQMKLMAQEGALLFQTGARDWCRLTAEFGGQSVKLGADTIQRICAKLIERLSDVQAKPPFQYKGMQLRTLLNLMEPHATVAYALNETGLELIKLDTDGTPIPLFSITDEEREAWIRGLRDALETYPSHA